MFSTGKLKIKWKLLHYNSEYIGIYIEESLCGSDSFHKNLGYQGQSALLGLPVGSVR